MSTYTHRQMVLLAVAIRGFCENFWKLKKSSIGQGFNSYYWKRNRKGNKERLGDAYGDSSPSRATIKSWFNEFKRGRTSTFDEPRPGGRYNAVTKVKLTKARDLLLALR